jgi:tRNA(fMet)-specific endonuclease VapC
MVRTFAGRVWLILLDTNVIIHYLKGDAGIQAAIRNTARSELALPAIVAYELEYGAPRSGLQDRRRRELERGLGTIQRVPFDSEAATASAKIRIELERQGLTIGPLDLLVAGTALSRGALLVTDNTVEFSRVAGLQVTDWRLGESGKVP